MPYDWADTVASKLLSRGLTQKGICLILGAADTGKTTLAAAAARHAASGESVGFIDADTGQSHIGPPTTVGWAIADRPQVDFAQLSVGGISFVGDITPVGHLLQLAAAVTRCFQQISELADLVIVDTPGFISGPAANVLWWTVQQTLQPELILAVQRNDELREVLAGLPLLDNRIEEIHCPPQIPAKSPRQRQSYRQKQLNKYFRDSRLYNIDLSNVAVQKSRTIRSDDLTNRLIGLRDEKGVDIAIGQLENWQPKKDIAVIRAPEIKISQVRCLVIGDVTVEIADE
jgi:polynucleotide 5'-hydroxyl-kinase GRC3/NOL9